MQAAQASPNSASAPAPFVISRTLDAPRDLVWKAFTDPERLKQWWGPKGFPVTRAAMDLRPGGTYHYALQVPDGTLMWGKFIYREITKPERIVFINGFSDETGALVRNPYVPTWPIEVHTVFDFTELGGRTVFTLRWTPVNATAEECEMFASTFEGMTAGWEGTLEQLDAHLATVRAEAAVLVHSA